jgi:hypothetical protein
MFLNQKIIDEIESWLIKSETSDYYKNRWKVMGLGLVFNLVLFIMTGHK